MKTEVRHILGGAKEYVRRKLDESKYDDDESDTGITYYDTRDPLDKIFHVGMDEIKGAIFDHSSYCEQGVLTELCAAATWLDRYRLNRKRKAKYLKWMRGWCKKTAIDVLHSERCTHSGNWIPEKDEDGNEKIGHYIWDHIWPKRCTAESFLAKAKSLEAWASSPIPDLPCGADDAYSERQEIAAYYARLYRAAIYFLVK
ncbi:MAG: hypothetical protein CMM02_18175 [Rhodopirellula sp.]|nr:hypothetical protein [Rhodopirellula sp.]|tara:strand:- start:43 stop:642 length:600 start_codon:yes stop_codon:yes gene_type:complete